MLPVASVLFLRASSACPLGHATESVLLRACGVLAVLKCALYELVRRPAAGSPSARASPRARGAHGGVDAHRVALPPPPPPPDLALYASTTPAEGEVGPVCCTTLDTLQAVGHPVRCGLQALIDADWAVDVFCAAYVALRRKVWAGRREKVSDNLDIWFGLDA
ncbi:hypothetical protein FB451DRAFT_1421768 [Mycena latifolia]|nr:hypothetical protein FB451DRAFT_1421768 [Mycena latifolia]